MRNSLSWISVGMVVGAAWFLTCCSGAVQLQDAPPLAATSDDGDGIENSGSQGPTSPCADGASSCYESAVRVVPKFDPYLSGMPFGTVSYGPEPGHYDVARADRIVVIESNLLRAGAILNFEVAGFTETNPPMKFADNADGEVDRAMFIRLDPKRKEMLSENGISTLIAPANSLIGVFLTNDRPDRTSPPTIDEARCTRDFSKAEARNQLRLTPRLKQIFFIGDGVTDRGDRQGFVVPEGATRLYLATMDGYGWENNAGYFDVKLKSTR